MPAKFIVIIGPTASGKSGLALHLAQKLNAVIVNSDSQQVYKELRILSARPSKEEEQLAPHLLYGHMKANEVCSAGKWLDMAREVIANETRPIIFVGGTGMYIGTLWQGLAQIPPIQDEVKNEVRNMPEAAVAAELGSAAQENHRRNVRALEVLRATGRTIKDWQKEQPKADYNEEDFLIMVMNVSRETLYKKCDARFLQMMEEGALDEVRNLKAMRLDPALPLLKACGVPELSAYLDGELPLEEAIKKGQQSVRNYAKRQLTWIRNQLPESKIEVQDMSKEEILNLVKQRLSI